MRRCPPTRPLALAPLLLTVLSLAGCADLLATVPPRPEAVEDQTVAEAAYPRLAEVPERPRLGYTLEQRRAIAEGLVADRANARYAGDDLRRDTGRPVAADTAPPLPPVPPPPAVADETSSDLALAYIEEALARDSDDGSLGDFLDRLEQPPPGSAAATAAPPPDHQPPEPPAAAAPAAAAPAATEPVETGAAETRAAETRAADSGPAESAPGETPAAGAAPVEASSLEPPPAPARETAALPTLPLRIPFAADGVDVEPEQRTQVLTLGRTGAGGRVLVVSGGGPRPGLAMERARRVAALLVAAGLAPERVAIEMAGDSDEVIVYEVAGETG